MLRAVVSKRLIDRLIREKLEEHDCRTVAAMPVVWRQPLGAECNWEIPGWLGDSRNVTSCVQRVSTFLQSLELQFDIADEC